MIEKRGKSSLGSAALLAGVAGAVVTACDVPVPTEPIETVEEVMVDRGPGAADVESAVVSLEGWDFLTYEGAPRVYLDGVRMAPERFEDMPEPVRSFLGDPVWDSRVERVEAVKRADAERLYGPEAAAGVIHVFTKDPIGSPRAHRRGAARPADEAPGLRGAATDTLVLASRAAWTLKERQEVIRDADFLAYGPIVSIDGVRVDRAAFLEFPPEHIERVEVIKGPHVACLVYGEEASGIILIFTRGAPELSQREALLGEDRGFTEEEWQRGREGCSGL